MKWAVKTRYLESKWNGNGKWHSHSTKWYDHGRDAWKENDKFLLSKKDTIVESSSGLMHKEK